MLFLSHALTALFNQGTHECVRLAEEGLFTKRGILMGFRFLGIDHVQLSMPRGQESVATAFYQDILGFTRVSKPIELNNQSGAWFETPGVALHLGVDVEFRPAAKAHPALLVQGFDDLLGSLEAHGILVSLAEPLNGARRAHIFDPFANRIELVEAAN